MITESDPKALFQRIEKAESEVRKQMGDLAALRKEIPRTEVKNYVLGCVQSAQQVQLYRLFELTGKDDLILVHNMGARCPGCTAWADGFNGVFRHLQDRAAFVVATPDSIEDAQKFKLERGWKFNMASASGTTLYEDMGFACDDSKHGRYRPGISTFRRMDSGAVVRIARATICPGDEYSSIFSLLNLTEGGSGGWFPKIDYSKVL
jgi:predicted dithiol-disulfide oxidoreductase (DUF899 family)